MKKTSARADAPNRSFREPKHHYSMTDALEVAHLSAQKITAWLWTRPETVDVHNVEHEPHYQSLDVDLLWVTGKQCYQVEIKADRWEKTGNFFFETHSNLERDTPGCFLYTQADLLFYHFVNTGALYILPVPETRSWFLERLHTFEERATRTSLGGPAGGQYTTVGRLVPIQQVVAAVPGVWAGSTELPPI